MQSKLDKLISEPLGEDCKMWHTSRRYKGRDLPLVLGVAPWTTGSTARNRIMGKNTPISAFRAWKQERAMSEGRVFLLHRRK